MTIQQRIKQIRLEANLTQEEFAAELGIKRANYSQIELGKQGPTLEQLTQIARRFGKSYDWLIEGKDYPARNSGAGNLKGNLKGNPLVKSVVVGREDSTVRKVFPEETVVDTSGHRLVPIVDIRAAAGEGYINPETIEESDVFRLPQGLVKGKNPLCIRIKGPSMAPTLNDGGYVIITLLDQPEWLNMRNNFIYVVVDVEGKAYIKRIKNRFSGEKGGFIVLTSDNPDKQSHPNFNLMHPEIAFIWNVEMYFTHKMPNIHDQYYTRLSNLEDQFLEVQNRVQKLEGRVK